MTNVSLIKSSPTGFVLSALITDLDPQESLSKIASQTIKLRLGRCLRLVQRLDGKTEVRPKHIHQIRVAARRAQAALRAFRSCLPVKRTKELSAMLTKLRRLAGPIRDTDVLLQRLSKEPPSKRLSGIRAMIKRDRRKVERVFLRKAITSKELKRLSSGVIRRIRWREESEEPKFLVMKSFSC